ncbi:MAG TPA: VOC family protein [Gaiellaceae bacterium]|nr:VOC family protein [Gaiellaceae bacterium]
MLTRGRIRSRAILVVLAGAIATGVLALAGSPAAAAPPVAVEKRDARGLLGLVGVDHVGLTVPDIDEAVAWFEDVMGCSAPLTFGPFSDPEGTFMEDLLDVHPRAVIEQITMIRCGRSANIELFEYDAPDQDLTFPKNSDWAGHHVAFYVTDIDAAVAYMEAKGVEKLLGPLLVTEGPAAGQAINYFRAPFGTYVELISYPEGMAYESDPGRPLWSPKRNGLDSVETSVPGLLGMDHVGITVPDIDEAVAWFEDVLRCSAPLTFGPFSDPDGTFMQDLLGVHPRAVIEQITLVRCGNGPNIELFQYDSPDQDRSFRRNSDYGGKHIAFYVRHIDKAVAYMEAKGVEKLLGPLPVTEGPAAGQTINYFRTPFGTYVELISYPKGMAYEETATTPLWDPRDNRP